MDICVVTNDARLARFIVLELSEVGFSAMHSERAAEAKLLICDLDYLSDAPADCLGFSYDENKSEKVDAFLLRPIDSEKLRKAILKHFSVLPAQKIQTPIEISTSTREAKTDLGKVRLSEKEFALLKRLYAEKLLTREDGTKIFGATDSNIVDVYVHYLRKKLSKIHGGETVKSKRGIGYSLADKINIKFT